MLNLTQKLLKIFAQEVGSEEFTRAAREPIPVTQILANLMITHLYSKQKMQEISLKLVRSLPFRENLQTVHSLLFATCKTFLIGEFLYVL